MIRARNRVSVSYISADLYLFLLQTLCPQRLFRTNPPKSIALHSPPHTLPSDPSSPSSIPTIPFQPNADHSFTALPTPPPTPLHFASAYVISFYNPLLCPHLVKKGRSQGKKKQPVQMPMSKDRSAGQTYLCPKSSRQDINSCAYATYVSIAQIWEGICICCSRSLN